MYIILFLYHMINILLHEFLIFFGHPLSPRALEDLISRLCHVCHTYRHTLIQSFFVFKYTYMLFISFYIYSFHFISITYVCTYVGFRFVITFLIVLLSLFFRFRAVFSVFKLVVRILDKMQILYLGS